MGRVSFGGETNHCFDIWGQDNPTFLSRPRWDVRITHPTEPNDRLWRDALELAASQKTGSEASRVETPRGPLLQRRCFDPLLRQIRVDLGGVIQEVGDDQVHVRQRDRRKSLGNLLRRRPGTKCCDDGVERHARALDAQRPVGVGE